MSDICAFTLRAGASLTNETDATEFYGTLCSYQISFSNGLQHFDEIGMDIPKNVTESERKAYVLQKLTDHLNDEFPGIGFTIQDMKDL